MKELVIAGLLTVAIVLGLHLVSPVPDWTEAQGETQMIAAAWQDACELSRYDCTFVDAPMVARTEQAHGALGFHYPGMGTVYVREGFQFSELKEYAVLVHEMVHYLQHESGAYAPFEKVPHVRCLKEEEAFNVYDAVIDKYRGDPALKRPYWYRVYPNCGV